MKSLNKILIKNKSLLGTLLAVSAAALYGISAPASKLLLAEISPTFLAALLYLGAGIGMLLLNVARTINKSKQREAKITKKELPYIIGMIVLDILAPILLLLGLSLSTSSNTALLNNFEIVATAIIARTLFSEAVSKRMWLSILLITLSVILLSIDNLSAFSFSIGSIFVIGACICWGLENNLTRKLSIKDPFQVVIIKGFGSGIGALVIAFLVGGISGSLTFILYALILGFVAYGLGIYLYILAQRRLGAARTSAFYATAPFIGVLVSLVFLGEGITTLFLIALGVMLLGTYFAVSEKHHHGHIHTNLIHEHKHSHDDDHHMHKHENPIKGEHSHTHGHERIEHNHGHLPDSHHRHKHLK